MHVQARRRGGRRRRRSSSCPPTASSAASASTAPTRCCRRAPHRFLLLRQLHGICPPQHKASTLCVQMLLIYSQPPLTQRLAGATGALPPAERVADARPSRRRRLDLRRRVHRRRVARPHELVRQLQHEPDEPDERRGRGAARGAQQPHELDGGGRCGRGARRAGARSLVVPPRGCFLATACA
jgi:hypothetical protein